MKKALIGILLAGAIGYIVHVLYQSTQQDVSSKVIQGIDIHIDAHSGAQLFMTLSDVANELRRQGLDATGESIASLDIKHIEQTLLRNPIFSSVEAYVSPISNRLKVRVRQREASFVVYIDNIPYYVTQERGIIPLSHSYAVHVPVATGAIDKEIAIGPLYDLHRAIDGDPYFSGYFGHYYVDAHRGFILKPRMGQSYILLGSRGSWSKKLDKLKAFDREVIGRKGWDGIEYINLSFDGQVIVKDIASSGSQVSDEVNS